MDASPGPVRDSGHGQPLPRPVRRMVAALGAAVFIQWAGAGAILPLLPLYVRHQGGSDLDVGGVMAAFFVLAFVCQYGAGRLSDRLGRVQLVVGGLVVYAGASLLFIVPGPAVADVAYRALQGAGAGAAEVAALAMVSHAVPMSHRGRAVSVVYTGQLGGFAVGPLAGSLAGLAAMHWLFVAAATCSVAAIVPVLVAHRSARGAAPVAPGETAASMPPGGAPVRPPVPSPARARALRGALLASSVVGISGGVYEACWTLLMTRNGASQWQVGLSWSLFCLPFAALSRPAGWLADHVDRRKLAVAALAWSLLFCATYPFVPGVVPLLVLGSGESFGFALALPACQSLLGEGTAEEGHGRAQGLFAAGETGATGLAAAAAGGLFGLAAWIPFVSAAACCAVVLAVVAWLWQPVPGRVAGAPGGRRKRAASLPG